MVARGGEAPDVDVGTRLDDLLHGRLGLRNDNGRDATLQAVAMGSGPSHAPGAAGLLVALPLAAGLLFTRRLRS